jgi:hypothetical protein
VKAAHTQISTLSAGESEAPSCPPSDAHTARAKESGKTESTEQTTATFNATFAVHAENASQKPLGTVSTTLNTFRKFIDTFYLALTP